MPIERWRVLYTSPEDDAHAALMAATQRATRSLHLLIYGFTLTDLCDVLIAKQQAGVLVGVVADHTQSTGHAQHALLQRLVDAGIDVVITTAPGGPIMHQKCLIVDLLAGTDANESFSCYGSFNFSSSAEGQANHLQTDNDPIVCAYFAKQYADMRNYGLTHPEWQIAPTGASHAADQGVSPGTGGAGHGAGTAHAG